MPESPPRHPGTSPASRRPLVLWSLLGFLALALLWLPSQLPSTDRAASSGSIADSPGGNPDVVCASVLPPLVRGEAPAPVDPAVDEDSPTGGTVLPSTVRSLVAKMNSQPLSEVWRSVDRLKQVGEDAIPLLVEELENEGEHARLGCAQVLLYLGDLQTREAALSALVELINTTSERAVKAAAINTLARHGEPEEVLEFLGGLFEKATHPAEVIPLARALFELDSVPEAQKRLSELVKSRDPEIRKDAAVALGELGLFDTRVREVLRELRREPTERGSLAAALYRNDQLYRQIETEAFSGGRALPDADRDVLLEQARKRVRDLERELRKAARDTGGGSLRIPELAVLEEVIALVDKHYVAPERVEHRNLVVAAARGIAQALDRFSAFMSPEEAKRFETEMAGEYCGIGVQVDKRSDESPLEIIRPLYSGPAYEKGLLTGDQILEVDGMPTYDRPADEVVARLKGPRGSTVKLKIYRRGWEDAREFEVERSIVEVPSVLADMLPQKIGLLKLTQFGDRSYEEFMQALDRLEQEGMQGLILDLRNNRGGMLSTAKQIVDVFVGERERPIVSVRGRVDEGGEEHARPTDAIAREDYPLVILVNRWSASASEIVAGALRDYHRASLVGERTYGKGTVQTPFYLSEKANALLGGPSRLKLTVKYYFLPSGRSIHTIRDADGKVVQEGGIEPHITVEPRRYSASLIDEIEKLRSSRAIRDYTRDHYETLKKLIVNGDAANVSQYPDFDRLYETLDTTADPDVVRQVLRYRLRRQFEDERGREIAGDFQDDPQLQQGILEILRKLKRDPASTSEYAWLKPIEQEKPETEQQ